MDVRDRMQHLGRRALKEPDDLTIPYGAQTSECHKPISMVPVKVQKHGWGEGRLPIPAFADVLTREELIASQQQKHAEVAHQRAKAAARAAEAAKMVKAEMQQPKQQLETVKARSRAAHQFSMVVERRNAEKLRKSAPSTPTKPAQGATKLADAAPDVLVKQAIQQQFSKPPIIERHILLRRPDSTPSSAEQDQTAADGTAAVEHATAAAAAAVSRAATLIEHLAEHVVTQADDIAADGLVESQNTAQQSKDRYDRVDDDRDSSDLYGVPNGRSSKLQQQLQTGVLPQQQQQKQQQRLDQISPQPPAEPSGLSAVLAAAVTTQQCLQELSQRVSAISVTAAAAGPTPPAAAENDYQALLGHKPTEHSSPGTSSPIESPAVVETQTTASMAAAAVGGSLNDDVPAADATPTATQQLAKAAAAAAAPVAAAEAAGAGAAHTDPATAVLPPAAAGGASEATRASGVLPWGRGPHQPEGPVSSSEASRKLLAFAAGVPTAPHLQQPNSSQPLTPVSWQHHQQQQQQQQALVGSAGRFGVSAHCTAGVRDGVGSSGVLQWSPVPPPTQMMKPLVVKQSATPASPVHAVKAQPQAVYHLQQEQRHQVRLKTRPPWQGVMDSAAAANKTPAATGDSDSCTEAGKSGSNTSKQASHQLMLPALCSCGHRTSPLDPAYPTRCCSNCPLHNNPEGWKRLVIGLGMIDGCGDSAVLHLVS